MIEREAALRAKAGLQDNTSSKVIIPEKDEGESNLPTTVNQTKRRMINDNN